MLPPQPWIPFDVTDPIDSTGVWPLYLDVMLPIDLCLLFTYA